MNTSQIPAWQGGVGEGENIQKALTVKKASAKESKGAKNFGSRTAPGRSNHTL